MAEFVPVRIAVLTVSDRVSRGEAEDGSGDLLEELLRGSLDRTSLHLAVASLPSAAHRWAWLADRLPQLPGPRVVHAEIDEGARLRLLRFHRFTLPTSRHKSMISEFPSRHLQDGCSRL